MDKLIELAERCEKSPSNSWDLDREIFKALFLPDVWFGSKVIGWFGDGPFGCNTHDGIRHLDCINAPNFTASIDAAMQLVPKGWLTLDRYSISDVQEHQQKNWRVWIKTLVGDVDGDGACGLSKQFATGATPALALCAAALRARAALSSTVRAPTEIVEGSQS